jgi:hypothetical protein
MQLERLSRTDAADRIALPADADSSDLRECLRLLETIEHIRVPAPSLDAQWQGRAALLTAVAQPRRRFSAPSLAPFPRRLTHALPGAALATLVIATTAGAAALAGVGAPGATVNEVLSALGFHDQAVRPVQPSLASPPASPLAGQGNLTWPPEAIETSIPVELPSPEETSGDVGPQTPGGSGQEPGQSTGVPDPAGSNPGHSGENPGHGGENPGHGVGPDGNGTPPGHGGENAGQGVGPDGSGTPPGQSGENPGQGGENPGHQEDQGGGTPPGQSGENPGQGNANGNGQGKKP